MGLSIAKTLQSLTKTVMYCKSAFGAITAPLIITQLRTKKAHYQGVHCTRLVVSKPAALHT